MHHHKDKLDHLQYGQVLLPPQIFLHFWSHGGQHVVRVHDDVNECIQKTKERTMTARREFDAPPNGCWHQTMMDHMQCRHLIVTFAHHKEDGIEEFCELGKVVPPTAASHLYEEKP